MLPPWVYSREFIPLSLGLVGGFFPEELNEFPALTSPLEQQQVQVMGEENVKIYSVFLGFVR